MNANKNSEFVVLKKSFTFQVCKTCDGSGKHFRTFRKMNFVEDCSVCHGEGRQRFTTTEEVPFIEALHEALTEIESRTNYHK